MSKSKRNSVKALELLKDADIERAIGGEAKRKLLPGWFGESDFRNREARRLEDQAGKLMEHQGNIILHESGEAIPESISDPAVDAFLIETMEAGPSQLAIDASHERLDLLTNLGFDAVEIGLDASATINAANSLEKMLAHQLGTVHLMAMKFMKASQDQLKESENNFGVHPKVLTARTEAAVKYVNTSIRLMNTYQKALQSLVKMRTSGQQTVRVIHQYIQVSEGGKAVVLDKLTQANGSESEEEGNAEK